MSEPPLRPSGPAASDVAVSDVAASDVAASSGVAPQATRSAADAPDAAPAEPRVAARCANHPERPANGGTCARCGNFVCAECWAEGAEPALCRPCLAHLERGPHLSHARVLGVLMMVHGGMMAAAGVYYVLFGGVMLDTFRDLPPPEGGGDPEMLDLAAGMVTLIVGSMGLANVVPGVLQAVAGWRALHLRGRRLSLFALAAGLVSVLGCYCAPTALALGGYGLWVLTRDDVEARFAVRAPAATKDA